MPQKYKARKRLRGGGGGGGMEMNKNRQTGTEGRSRRGLIQLLFKSNSADLDPTQQSHYAA